MHRIILQNINPDDSAEDQIPIFKIRKVHENAEDCEEKNCEEKDGENELDKFGVHEPMPLYQCFTPDCQPKSSTDQRKQNYKAFIQPLNEDCPEKQLHFQQQGPYFQSKKEQKPDVPRRKQTPYPIEQDSPSELVEQWLNQPISYHLQKMEREDRENLRRFLSTNMCCILDLQMILATFTKSTPYVISNDINISDLSLNDIVDMVDVDCKDDNNKLLQSAILGYLNIIKRKMYEQPSDQIPGRKEETSTTENRNEFQQKLDEQQLSNESSESKEINESPEWQQEETDQGKEEILKQQQPQEENETSEWQEDCTKFLEKLVELQQSKKVECQSKHGTLGECS